MTHWDCHLALYNMHVCSISCNFPVCFLFPMACSKCIWSKQSNLLPVTAEGQFLNLCMHRFCGEMRECVAVHCLQANLRTFWTTMQNIFLVWTILTDILLTFYLNFWITMFPRPAHWLEASLGLALCLTSSSRSRQIANCQAHICQMIGMHLWVRSWPVLCQFIVCSAVRDGCNNAHPPLVSEVVTHSSAFV